MKGLDLFGEDLKKIRKRRKLSQEDVEFLTGISVRNLSRMENARVSSISISTLFRLSSVYERDLIDLYKKYIHQAYRIYDEIKNSLTISIFFKDRDYKHDLLNKLSVLEEEKEFINRFNEINLIRIFLGYLLDEDAYKLKDNYQELTRLRVTNNNILKYKYTSIEERILLSLCESFSHYNGYFKEDIIDYITNTSSNNYIKFLATNSKIINLYKKGHYEESICLIDRAIRQTENFLDTERLLYLYYNKAICDYSRGDENFKSPLRIACKFAYNLKLDKLHQIIERNSKKMLNS